MTELAYMTEPQQTEMQAIVEKVELEDAYVTLTLNRTPIYPQGGGQPSDTGAIEGDGYTFAIRKAVLVEGTVRHQGIVLDGTPVPGPARVKIDPGRRALNEALHSGGHLIMTAMFELTGMRAAKGYHFPDGPYVEFDGTVDAEARDDLLRALQHRLDEMVENDEEILVELSSVEEIVAEGIHVPASIPDGKPVRVVTTCGYRSPCGGTHVARTGELSGLVVRRMKCKKDRTRISYELEGRAEVAS